MSLIINYVWVGTQALDSVAKFNIYTWRALGHEVFVYHHHTEVGTAYTLETLGVEQGDVISIDLHSFLLGDGRRAGQPWLQLQGTRTILSDWLRKPIGDVTDPKDYLYNVADLTKSVLGATQQGIVLDLKTGPSEFVPDYESCFQDHFVSYTRGSNCSRVENQCMGTMQQTDGLRSLYAKRFEECAATGITNLVNESRGTKQFDRITGFHGKAYAAAKPNIDVAKTPPPNSGKELAFYEVGELSGVGYGPFRVFKPASNQSNKGVSDKGLESKQGDLCDYVLKQFKDGRYTAEKQDFVKKMKDVVSGWPKKPLW